MLHIFTQDEIHQFINLREGEVKLGEVISTIHDPENFFKQVENSKSKFVIIGVPEDIGVKMNKGNGGAHTAFTPSLKVLLNIQENQFITGKDILLLGYLDFLQVAHDFTPDDPEKGDYLVKQIDLELSKLIHFLISVGKTPIIIGGGHNNSYGNLKGLATAKKSSINVVNLDAHTDLRKLEERHSGNGFSYAIHDGFLDHYFMFGLHQNYTPQYIFDRIHENMKLEYNTFEALEIYKSVPFENELQRALNFVKEKPFGIEVDLDAIQNFPSSAMTPTGFSPQQTRQFVHFFGKNKNASYLHICEGAPSVMQDDLAINQVGKFISYLITDFIKANNGR
ncbi:formimidoylglutamase [Tenacibaculum maritimum]|uniref:formimidoylglutamase n=1 Tax=Tenacibaculum maritimum TaxID=107401 RepID=UPI0012E57BE4|nr:formimidoylglutamase [Tenacibaculum maritimum]CAA0228859.1 Formimidoylglutamase [Tenacibaculum maritimum]